MSSNAIEASRSALKSERRRWPATHEFRDWWAEYLRMGASPGAAVALTRMNANIDVRKVLPLVRVPTLVMHRRDDLCPKIEEDRFVADRIPGARFVELEGNDHLPFGGDQETVLAKIEEFVNGLKSGVGVDRVLATVMSVRLIGVDSFRLDADLAKMTREFIRRKLDLFRGREIQYCHGQILAIFEAGKGHPMCEFNCRLRRRKGNRYKDRTPHWRMRRPRR